MRRSAGQFTMRHLRSESPHQSSGSAKIILSRAQHVCVHVVELQAPGKVMKKEELKFAIHAAAGILRDRVVSHAIRCHALGSAHDVDEGTPLAVVEGKSWAQEQVVLLNSPAIKTAAIQDHANVGMAGEGEVFEGRIPSAKRVAVIRDDVDGIAVSDSNIHVSARKQLRFR